MAPLVTLDVSGKARRILQHMDGRMRRNTEHLWDPDLAEHVPISREVHI